MTVRSAYSVAMERLAQGCLVVCTPVVHVPGGRPDVAVSAYQPVEDDDATALEVASDGTMADFLLGVMHAARQHLDEMPDIDCR